MTTAETGRPGVAGPGDLSYYFRVLQRNVAVLVAVAAVVVLVAGVYVLRTPETYLARATVTIRVITATPFQASVRPDVLVVPATETKIATSFGLATRAAALLGKAGEEGEVSRSITVTVPPKSQVMVLEYRAATPREAAAGANAYATAYLEQRAATAQAEQSEALRRLDAEVRSLRDELRRTSAALATQTPGSANELDSTAYRDVLRTQLIGVLERRSAIAAMPTVPGELVTEARPPSGPAAPNAKQLLLGGMLVGLVLGVVGAFVRDRTNPAVRDTAELEAASGLPVLADLPAPSRARGVLVGQGVGDAVLTRAYQQCAARLASAENGDRPPRPLLVVDLGKRDHADVVAANIAAARARTGSQTALVFSERTSEPLREALDVTGEIGLTDVVRGKSGLADAVHSSRVPRLSVLSAGGDSWALQELVAKAWPAEVLAQLRADYDCVVVAAPSPTQDLDTVLRMARWASILVVAERGRTSRATVAAFIADLRSVDGDAMVGTVLRGPVRRRGRSAPMPAPRTIVVRRPERAERAERAQLIGRRK